MFGFLFFSLGKIKASQIDAPASIFSTTSHEYLYSLWNLLAFCIETVGTPVPHRKRKGGTKKKMLKNEIMYFIEASFSTCRQTYWYWHFDATNLISFIKKKPKRWQELLFSSTSKYSNAIWLCWFFVSRSKIGVCLLFLALLLLFLLLLLLIAVDFDWISNNNIVISLCNTCIDNNSTICFHISFIDRILKEKRIVNLMQEKPWEITVFPWNLVFDAKEAWKKNTKICQRWANNNMHGNKCDVFLFCSVSYWIATNKAWEVINLWKYDCAWVNFNDSAHNKTRLESEWQKKKKKQWYDTATNGANSFVSDSENREEKKMQPIMRELKYVCNIHRMWRQSDVSENHTKQCSKKT